MEYIAFQQNMDSLLRNKIRVGALVTDRRTSIDRHMRDDLKDIHHYFDLWHLKKCNVFYNLFYANLKNLQNLFENLFMFYQKFIKFSQKSQRKVVVKL